MARVAFLQSFWFEFLGPMYISSYLKKHGHQVELFLSNGSTERLVSEVLAYDPQIIAFSCTSGSHQWASVIAGEIQKKRKEILSVMGGPHPTFYPEAIHQPHIDVIVQGEGEEAMLDIVEAVVAGQSIDSIANTIHLKDGKMVINPVRSLIDELDVLPPPDRSLYYKYTYLRKNPNKHVITGRGCPFQCTFCCNKAYKELYAGKGKVVRRHSVARVIDDIRELRDRYGLSTVRFDDEVFILSPRWIGEFLECYEREIHLPFSCLLRADLLTKELGRALKNAGCYIAYFGIESGNDALRNEVLKKKVTREHILNTAAILRECGIKSGTFNMLGLPGESLDNAFETVTLNQEIRADLPWCSVLQPYPRTELEEIAVRQGYIDRETTHVEALSNSYFNRSIIKNPHARELENLQKFFFIVVKFPRLTKLVRRLIFIKPNIVFDMVFQVTYAYRYIKTYRISLVRIVLTALKMKGHF